MLVRDDRILPATRTASLVVVCILVPAVVVLWGFPEHTADAWAWTFKPAMTAVFMGSGYAAGAYFFARVWRGSAWHAAAPGVLGAAAFAAIELVVTLIHWDRFNHGHGPVLAVIAFAGWVVVYLVAPFAVFWLWWRNRATDPRVPAPGDAVVPGALRAGAAVFGTLMLVTAAVFLVHPATAIDVWPWKLTPLTARVLAGFIAQVGLGAVLLSRDARRSAWPLLLQAFLVASVLLAAGALRVS